MPTRHPDPTRNSLQVRSVADLEEAVRALAFHFQTDGVINYKTYGYRFGGDLSAFILAIDLEKDDSDSFVSGDDSRGVIEIKILHSKQPTSDLIYYAYLMRDTVVQLTPQGVYVTE